MNIVIMAGGGGTRLWPLSRQGNPKQFLDLGSGKTLLEHTYDRALALAEVKHIFIATIAEYLARIQQLLPAVPAENIFLEPRRRDTAPAFLAAALQLKAHGQADEPVIFMWSDHVFTNESEFLTDLKKIPALIQAHPTSVVILGHTPTSPETGFGYLEVGAALSGQTDVFTVKAFKEKPDRKTAEEYVAAGNFYWNMAYVSLTPAYLLAQLAQHAPDLMAQAGPLEAALASHDEAAFQQVYTQLPKISIDYALLEKTPDIIAVTGDYGWSDVGSWAAVKEMFGSSGDHMPAGHHIHVDSKDNYVYNATDKTVSLIGVKNCIVVVTEDAILITDKDSSHRVKEVVERLEAEGKE